MLESIYGRRARAPTARSEGIGHETMRPYLFSFHGYLSLPFLLTFFGMIWANGVTSVEANCEPPDQTLRTHVSMMANATSKG